MMNGKFINIINEWSNKAGLLFLLLLLATFMNDHVNAFRNIGLYGVVIAVIIYSITRKWEIKSPDGFVIVLTVFALVVLQGVLRNEHGIGEGLHFFRRTYFKGFVLAIGIPLFVANYRAIKMVIISLFVSAVGVLFSEIYRYLTDANSRFFYAGAAIRRSAHLIDFIDPIVVACTRYTTPLIRYSSIAIIVGFTILVIGTGTRGGWLALVAGFLVTYFLVNMRNNMVWTIAKSSVRVVIIVVGAYFLAPQDSIVKNRFDAALTEPVRTELIFPIYYNQIIDGPLFGMGYSKQIEYRIGNTTGEDNDDFSKATYHGPHNQFLLYGVYFGIIGVAVYLIVIVWTLLRLIRRSMYEEDLGMRLLSAAATGMLVAQFVVRSMADVVPGHWLGVPVGIALINLRNSKE